MRWLNWAADKIVPYIENKVAAKLTSEMNQHIAARLASLETRLLDAVQEQAGMRQRRHLFVPDLGSADGLSAAQFLQYSTCNALDFMHPRFLELCTLLDLQPLFHRKQWEFAFIAQKLIDSGRVAPGKRGLGFGVGSEPLPAAFASLGADIVATDAPAHTEAAAEWTRTGQHADAIGQLFKPAILDRETFASRVTFQPCDMSRIDASLTGFDFNWSSCCFEHLGSIELGKQFVMEAVERTLVPGGIACHTTELNLSSDEETIDNESTVLYRRSDLADLTRRLQSRGHRVHPIVVSPYGHPLDFFVDVAPYAKNPHLKLEIGRFTTTSVGIVVERA